MFCTMALSPNAPQYLKKNPHITGKHWQIPVTYSTISMRQGLLFERLVLAIGKEIAKINWWESREVFALTSVAPWVKPPAWPVFCWWVWDAVAVVLSEECFWRQGQDNDMLLFLVFNSGVTSWAETYLLCIEANSRTCRILCSGGEVVVVPRLIGTSDTALFAPHSGDWLGLNAKGRSREAVCGYLEEMETSPKPAVTAMVKCDIGRLCCTYFSLKFRRTEVCSYILFSSSQVLSPTPWSRAGSVTENQE